MTRLGYQIPNFTYPNLTGHALFQNVVAQAKAAEDAGFDRVLVMDHFYQLPGLGTPDEAMFECYTLLSALCSRPAHQQGAALGLSHWQYIPQPNTFSENNYGT
ncbi:MAG: LLM class flavin-dependent oxidoreductase [Ilumatobacteraceae bacterium]|nr:LLM class flavin-dependent oxidoreductase [Ilumatobacteraceae bacterium]